MDAPTLGNLPILELVAATGALGVAASAIVQGLKVRRVRSIGFTLLRAHLGERLYSVLTRVFGGGGDDYLRALYVDNRRGNNLRAALRQGARFALVPDAADDFVGVLMEHDTAEALREALERVHGAVDADAVGEEPEEEPEPWHLHLVARVELALQGRIDAALAAADHRYRQAMYSLSVVFAVGLALVVGRLVDPTISPAVYLVCGLVAVPLAPVTHDVVKAVSAVARVARAAKG